MKATTEQAERLHRFAHDLRNRLIGLQQVLEHLRQGPSEEERNEFATFGEQQYFKALREVESLMDDLAVPRGSAQLTLDKVTLAGLVRGTVDQLQFRFQRKDQTVVLDLDEDLVVNGDTRMLTDLVEALLSNASKFSASGTTIEVRLHSEGKDAVIRVVDHGTGLCEKDLQHVFVRFAWLQNRPTSGESQGRGTLSRARDWAHAHRGTLTAHSEGNGHGCTFTLRLPKIR